MVVAGTDESGDQRLVAYLVEAGSLQQTGTATQSIAGDLRDFLKGTLPEYMLPAVYVFIPALPLTPNGKIDRKALPAPSAPEKTTTGASSPETEIEKKIALIWEDVLGIKGIGVHDHFFTIGGQSLKAVRVVARMQKDLGTGLKLRDFFADPTVAGLAKLASNMNFALPETIPRLGDAASYPLSHAQKRLWLLDQTSQGSASYNMSGSWLIEGPLDLPLLQNCFEEITARHESFRTSFIQQEGVPCQVIAPGVKVAIVETDLRTDLRAKERAEELARKEGVTPFRLSKAPLLRIQLIKLPAGQDNTERSVLVVTIHHIIGDGWSIGILMGEMTRLYAGE
ncbi:MAG: condensation domain-containing protein, partial [Deltaproteobacteria bacterium]